MPIKSFEIQFSHICFQDTKFVCTCTGSCLTFTSRTMDPRLRTGWPGRLSWASTKPWTFSRARELQRFTMFSKLSLFVECGFPVYEFWIFPIYLFIFVKFIFVDLCMAFIGRSISCSKSISTTPLLGSTLMTF